jgi:hypothetical protein
MTAYTGGYRIKDALVKFASTNFGNQVKKARLVPDVKASTYQTLVPDGQIVDIDAPVWTLELAGVQDYEAGGLADYLRDNSGTLQTVVIAPRNATGKQQWTVSVMCLPVPVGGEQGQWAEFDVELPVQGQPALGTVT